MSSKKTVRLTMAQALVKFLANQYVEIDAVKRKFVLGVFGIFGHGNVAGLAQALEQNPQYLRYYRVQNEQSGVHAGIAAAKHLNRLGCFAVASSIGPGATNMVTGAATATVNRIPILLLPADIFGDRQPDPVLQQIEQQYDPNLVANDCFKPVCRYWDRISRPEQLMTAVINAMRVLTDPVDTGAVCLCLPQDVQCEAYDYPEEFFRERVHRIDRRPISKESLRIAVKKIMSKKRPLAIAGGGIHYSLAAEQLKEFVEKIRIPVAFTNAGNSALRWDIPQNLGGMGVAGTLPANMVAKEADLIIALGTRLMDFTTISKSAFQNPNVELLAINVSNFDAYKMDAIPILADAKEALIAITEELTKRGYRVDKAYEEEYMKLKVEWNREVDRQFSRRPREGSLYLPQPAVIGVLNEFLGEDDVVINAAGSVPGDMHRLWRSKGPKTYHLEYGYSCMGYEIAGGLGVKLVDPDRSVYVIVGDGSYLMLHTEIATSLMENRKLVILCFDSEGFNSIDSLARSMGSEGFGNELRDRNSASGLLNGPFHQIDFAANARSYGATAYRANSLEEVREYLERAKREPKTTLIHIKIERFSQTQGYESWWRLGVSEVSTMPKVQEARRKMERLVKTARKY